MPRPLLAVVVIVALITLALVVAWWVVGGMSTTQAKRGQSTTFVTSVGAVLAEADAVVIAMAQHRHTRAEPSIERLRDAWGVTAEWMPGTDGQALTREDMARQCAEGLINARIPNIQGCFHSHIRAWQRCAASGAPLIIFEDDVVAGHV
jgi:hypothetical protein